MKKLDQSGREFLGLIGASAARLSGSKVLGSNVFAETESTEVDPRHADLVVFNPKVYTIDSPPA